MSLFLSVPEAWSQCPPIEQRWSIRQPWTIPLIDVAGKSHGYRQTVNLRPGLNILIDDYTLQDDLIVETGNRRFCEPKLEIEMSFMLSGHNRREKVQPCYNFFSTNWCDADGGQAHWQADEHVLKFDIHIKPDLFETLVGEQFETLLPCLKRITQQPQPSQAQFRHMQLTTAAMQSAIHQILHCPYQGLTRWLYLESKVIELIALRLDPVIQHPPADCVKPALQAEDRDRLYQARDILFSRLDNPPLVLELAKEVGLNHNKLKRGFRQVFGTTVFGYSQLCRLEKARQLLYEGHLTVAAVASEVGYANAAKFASAFKRKFGITPSACRLGTKRV